MNVWQLTVRHCVRHYALAVVAIFAFTALGSGQDSSAKSTLFDHLTGKVNANWTLDEIREAQLLAFKELLPDLASPSDSDRIEAQRVFEAIGHHASRPDAEPERLHWCRLMAGAQTRVIPKSARAWMLRKLAEIGRDESVAALATTLEEDDGDLRELARRALQKNPDSSATDILENALENSEEKHWTIAIIGALGARRSDSIADRLGELALAGDADIARAAMAALGDQGTRKAQSILLELHNAGGPLRYAAALAALRVADRSPEDRARFIYTDFYRPDSPLPIRLACFTGMARTGAEQTYPLLRPIVQGREEPNLRSFAIGLIRDIRDPAILAQVHDDFGNVDEAGQVLLLNVFGDRGDAAARPTVLTALDSASRDVRIAALEALVDLGDGDSALRVARVSANSQGELRKAARQTLGRMKDKECDAAIANGLSTTTEPELRAELLRAAGRRKLPDLERHIKMGLTADASAMRLAAIESAVESETIPVLDVCSLLVDEPDRRVRRAAEDALIRYCRDKGEGAWNQCAIVMRSQMQKPGDAVEISWTRISGELQADGALRDLETLARMPGEVREAAIRALGGWRSRDAARLLLDLAKGGFAEDLTKGQKIIALRGYLRLLREDPAPNVDPVEAVGEAFDLAERDDERRLALSVLGALGTAEALRAAQSHLERPGLEQEAARATIEIAGRLSATQPDLAEAALSAVDRGELTATTRRLLTDTRQRMTDHRGYVGAWRYAGPYTADDKNATELLAHAFPPETKAMESVEWRLLDGLKNPWVMDFTELDSRSNRVIYLRTVIESDRDQDVFFVLGSDDGVRVRLDNGVIHEFAGTRALNPKQDRVKVELTAGRHDLEAKISQGGGGWGFALRIEDANGNPAPGIRIRP